MTTPIHVVICVAVSTASMAVFGAASTPTATQSSATSVGSTPVPSTMNFGRGSRGGARGGLTVHPPDDAETVTIAPPVDKTGNFTVAPQTRWVDVPPIAVKDDVPRGKVTMFAMKSEDTKLYPGVNGPYQRNVWVYVPAGHQEGTELPLMVDHDGRADAVIQTQLIAVLDNYIAEKRLPKMAAVFIANGGDVTGRSERSLEYDTVSGQYAEYIEKEVLPLAEKNGHVKFTRDPDGRGVIGQSSGSAAALAMAWFHNEWYTRVISYSGTFVNIRNGPDAPHGAWEYHENLIPKSGKKNIRIWFEVGSRDNSFTASAESYRNWPLANNLMAEALRAKGYEYQYVWAEDAGHVERGVERQTLPEAMEWVWRTYHEK
jgi:enterochelin esterase family protein